MAIKDDVAERLIEQAAALVASNTELILQNQKALAVNSTISAIHVEIDAILGAAKELEKGKQLDEMKLKQLKDQLGELTKLVEGVERKSNSWWEQLNHIRMEEEKRWEVVRGLIAKLRWWAPVIGIVLAVSVMVLAGLFIWLASR